MDAAAQVRSGFKCITVNTESVINVKKLSSAGCNGRFS